MSDIELIFAKKKRSMVEALVENPILLIVLVFGIGFGLGKISIFGIRLGPAAVLFTGLFFGSMSPDLNVPQIIILLGLAIFLYSVGLSSGPSFFANLKQSGQRDILFVFLINGLYALSAILVFYFMGFDASTIAGMFSGTATSTASLAAFVDMVRSRTMDAALINELIQNGVVGYSLTYPMGVLASMIGIVLLAKLFKVDFKKEEAELSSQYPVKKEIRSASIRIENEAICGIAIRDLKRIHKIKVVFGRMRRGGGAGLVHFDTAFKLDDEVMVIGDAKEVGFTAELFGSQTEYDISNDNSEYSTRRIFVSNPKVAGETLASLNLSEKFSAIVTRVIRGDIDIIADQSTVVELGDRVRVVAKRGDVAAVKEFFGDSYEKLASINLFTFGIGLAIGLLLGMITFTIPGGVEFRLGYAGGPLIVGLILGSMRKTGNIVWSLPYGANITLRQIGLMLLLAGIGINSGHTFMNTIFTVQGGMIFLGGVIIAMTTVTIAIVLGYKLFKIPFSILMGFMSNQPAILEFALNKCGNKLPIIGFSLMLPITVVLKIIIVQLLFAVFY